MDYFQVNRDGVISIGSPFDTPPSPFPLNTADTLIAPFWDSIDPSMGRVFYRFSMGEDELIEEVRMIVNTAFGSSFNPLSLFVATWDRVPQLKGDPDLVSVTSLL